MMSGRSWKSLLLLISGLAFAVNANTTVRDDLTTDYAKQIIRQSKMAEMKNMLNPQISPCEDFYAYACGNWHRQNPAQFPQILMTDTFQIISKGFNRRLQRLLQSGKMNSKLEEKVQAFYKSCSQANRNDVHYALAFRSIYMEYGNLPMLAGDEWNPPKYNWWQTVAHIKRKYDKSIIFDVTIMVDIKNKTQNAIYFTAPSNENLVGSNIISMMEDLNLTKMLEETFGITTQLAKRTAKQINGLQRSLIECQNIEADTIDQMFIPYNVEELQLRYASYFNLTEYLEIVLGEHNVPNRIYVLADDFLNDTLNTVEATSSSTLGNYILWQLMEQFVIDTSISSMPKWCTEQTRKFFNKLVEHMIYGRYRTAEGEAEVKNIWDQMRNIFRQKLSGDKLDWISNRTRTAAIEKLDKMELRINAYDNENFDAIYGNLTLDPLNYVANLQKLLMIQANQTLDRLHSAPSSVDVTQITSFTPAYDILSNFVSIPVALLQPHYFWDPLYPHALKYATLGFLIAHEMIHGFDEPNETWDSRSRYEFQEKHKCFQAQYHNYKYGDHFLPLSDNQDENIADNGGIKLAYAAYQVWLKEQTPEMLQQETLSGLDLSNRQLFFLGYAQLWCDDVQSLFKSAIAKADTHAPSMYRVIGSLSNFQEFAWVFNCSQKARMDPEFKCSIF